MQVQDLAAKQVTEAVKHWQHEQNMFLSHTLRKSAESARIEVPAQQQKYEGVYLGKPAC